MDNRSDCACLSNSEGLRCSDWLPFSKLISFGLVNCFSRTFGTNCDRLGCLTSFFLAFGAFSLSWSMAENLYACVYFASDKTVSVVPKSRCILQGEFKEQEKVRVKWRVQGKQQVFIGTILNVCPKRK